jgi:hypothetical protein
MGMSWERISHVSMQCFRMLSFDLIEMFWKSKEPQKSVEVRCAESLFQTIASGLKKNGRIRTEDCIVAIASILAEQCIEVAGNFNPRKHQFVPGSRVFSDKVNELFSGDLPIGNIGDIPASSIVGKLRELLLPAGYHVSDFPSLDLIFEQFAANVGKASDWGKVPWSVPEPNLPLILPLRVAYTTRSTVDQIFQPLASPQQKLNASIFALAKVLIEVQQVIDRKIALLLAIETINGMAKTAPMTDEAMAAAKERAMKKES